MSAEPQLFRVNPETHESESITEVEFAQLGFQERRDIQEWIAANPSILGEDLLIIGKEFSGFDRTNERLDLLAVDSDGKLVVIELKRDDSGADAHWQAIKYASYLRHAGAGDIIGLLVSHAKVSEESAANILRQHIGDDDFSSLNHDQRIILASHRFAPEVTSAALWLNDKSPVENLITCIQLVPYMDSKNDALYVQANTIIPTPGTEDYTIGIGSMQDDGGIRKNRSLGAALSRTSQRNINDEVTPFVRKIGELVVNGLPDEISPDRRSRWGVGGPNLRHYQFWYSSPPWGNWRMSYRIDLYPQEESGLYRVVVLFIHDQDGLNDRLTTLDLHDEQRFEEYREEHRIRVEIGTDTLNGEFAENIANMVKKFIRAITPIVNDFLEEREEEPV